MLSGAVVASAAVWPGKVNALIAPKDGTAEDGGSESRACTCGARCRSVRPRGAPGQMQGSCVRPPD